MSLAQHFNTARQKARSDLVVFYFAQGFEYKAILYFLHFVHGLIFTPIEASFGELQPAQTKDPRKHCIDKAINAGKSINLVL